MIIERSTREVWAEQVRAVIESPDQAKVSADQGRAYIKKHRRAALHIESLNDAYESLLAAEANPDPS